MMAVARLCIKFPIAKHMKIFCLFLLTLFYGTMMYGQKYDHPFHDELRTIKPQLKRGDTKSLHKLLSYRENHDTISDFLGHHWGQNTISGVVWRTFSEYYLFESDAQEALFDTNQTAFAKSIRPELNSIRFSDVAQAFFLVPPEKRALAFRLTGFNASKSDKPADILKIHLEDLKSDLEDEDLDDEDMKEAIKELNNIARLNCPEAEAFIRSCFTPDFFKEYPFRFKTEVYETAAFALSYYPTLQHVDFILKLTDDHILTEKQAIRALEQITAIPFNDVTFEKNRYAQVVAYIRHFKTMEELRLSGYEKRYPISSSDFENKTDYYGKLLILSDDNEDYICYRNAFYDLSTSKDPVSLKYLAGMYYRHRSRWNDYHFYHDVDPNPAQMIEKLTGLQVQVENEKNAFTSEYEWGMARLHYFLYWNNHHNDYVWNDSLNSFVNTKTPVAKPDVVTEYYHQLSSKHDSVVSHAFLMLTESDPEKVKELLRISPDILKDADDEHYVLPTFPEKRLVALVNFTDYCKDHAIVFRPGEDLKQQLDSLQRKKTEADLYRLEESLIKHISLDQLSAVEYWAASGGEDAPYSIGRILDKLYTRYMDTICKDEDQLRLFLKKATVFDRFGIIGVCNKYLWKLSNRPENFKDRLQSLLAKEKDPDMTAAIHELLKNNYWKSDCAGDVPALYDEPINELETLNRIGRMPFEERGNNYSNLQYNLYFTDRVAKGSLSQSQLKPMVKCLKEYAETKKDDSFEFNRSLSFSYWLKINIYHTTYNLKKRLS